VDALLTVALIALATHRLTLLVVEDRVTRRPRDFLQLRFERAYEKRTGTVSDQEWLSAGAYLLSCRWCMSIYVGGAVIAATAYFTSVPSPVLVWLAASSVTGLLGGQHGR
jgi:hypothetical protein